MCGLSGRWGQELINIHPRFCCFKAKNSLGLDFLTSEFLMRVFIRVLLYFCHGAWHSVHHSLC